VRLEFVGQPLVTNIRLFKPRLDVAACLRRPFLSPAARTLTLASVARMSDEEAERSLSGSAGPTMTATPTARNAVAARSTSRAVRRLLRFQCKACHKDFSLTSGTLFASRKLPLRGYLMAIAVFINEVKGKSMLALSRDLGTSYKASFVMAHKLREAMLPKSRRTRSAGKAVRRKSMPGGSAAISSRRTARIVAR
jgi:transposase-like protein